MSGYDNNCKDLSRRQLKAIPIILQAKNITEGANNAGITRQTFYEWYQHPEFRTEFTRQRQEVIDLALHELKTLTGEAVDVLRNLLKAEGEGVRLRTALGVLEHVGKFIELEDLEKRISDIERSLNR